MPRKHRVTKTRHEAVSPALVAYFETGHWPVDSHGQRTVGLLSEVFLRSDVEVREDWRSVADDVLASWVVDHPGSRPWAWWCWDAPRWQRADWPARLHDLGPWADGTFCEPRRRLGGTGTPAYAVMNYMPAFDAGIPAAWVTPFDQQYYNGKAEDIDGHAIGKEFHDGFFAGVAPDPTDPPRFESQASYLQRHHLLTPAEVKHLPADAFEPELVTVVPEPGIDPRAEFPGVFDGKTWDETRPSS